MSDNSDNDASDHSDERNSSDSDASHGFYSEASYTVDESSRIIHAARPSPQWKFLNEWFRRVAGRVAISDAERVDSHSVCIGREMNDMWIDVIVEDGSTSGYEGIGGRKEVDSTKRVEKLRGVREGVLLLSALARVDYTSWIGGLVRKAGFPVPLQLELRACPEIAREYCFFLNSFLDPVYYQWDLLKEIVGDYDFSDKFEQDLALIQQIAKTKGRDGDLFDVIPIKLAIEPEETDLEKELEILRGVTQTIRELLAMNTRNEHLFATASARTRPLFRFESIDLNLRGFSLHPDVFYAIQQLLETGVRVNKLKLPSEVFQEDVSKAVAWSELVATALGHMPLASERRVHISHLEVSEHYVTEEFMIPLCSALRTTKALKSLSLSFGRLQNLCTESQRRIWTLIDYALFTSTPSNTIDTLALNGIKLQSAMNAKFLCGVGKADPVGELWRRITGNVDDPYLLPMPRPAVRIARGTKIALLGFDESVPEITTRTSCVGTLFRDDASQPSVRVLVPGYGVCAIARDRISPVEGSLDDTHAPRPIETLTLHVVHNTRHDGDGDDVKDAMRSFIDPVIEFVGPSLTALDIGCELLDESDLETLPRMCPNLHSLSVRSATVETMAELLGLYEPPTNARISSLDLSHLHIPIEAFEDFLRALTPEHGHHPIQKRLERLRIGRGYSATFRPETFQAMKRLLLTNPKLTHFILFQREREQPRRRRGGWFDDSDDDDDDHKLDLVGDGFNGEEVIGHPFAMDRSLAFLSVVRHLADQQRAGGTLGADLIRSIFSFAADVTWRRAFTERDVDSEFLDFMRQHMPELFQ